MGKQGKEGDGRKKEESEQERKMDGGMAGGRR